MPSVHQAQELYQQLADWYEQKGQAQMRDRFLVLAADAAMAAGRGEVGERLRMRLLQQNPHHLLKPYGSLVEAMKAPDVQSYVADLRRSYSPDTTQHLLDSLRAQASEQGPPQVAARSGAAIPPSPEPAKQSPEVLKFYRVQEPEPVVPEPVAQRQVPVTRPLPKPPVAPAPALAPSRPPAASLPPAPKRPPQPQPKTPVVSPFALETSGSATPRPIVSEGDERDLATGYWVASGLFGILLLAGLALAGYTLARPFLPLFKAAWE